jgi:hypothetical protein
MPAPRLQLVTLPWYSTSDHDTGVLGDVRSCAMTSGVVDNDTKYLIHEVLGQSPDGSQWLVEWVGYGRGDRTWEPESAIGQELLQKCRRRSLRSTVM